MKDNDFEVLLGGVSRSLPDRDAGGRRDDKFHGRPAVIPSRPSPDCTSR